LISVAEQAPELAHVVKANPIHVTIFAGSGITIMKLPLKTFYVYRMSANLLV
jgi:hypothetical protein